MISTLSSERESKGEESIHYWQFNIYIEPGSSGTMEALYTITPDADLATGKVHQILKALRPCSGQKSFANRDL